MAAVVTSAGLEVASSDCPDRLVGLVPTRRGRQLRTRPTARAESKTTGRRTAELVAPGAGAGLRAGLSQCGKSQQSNLPAPWLVASGSLLVLTRPIRCAAFQTVNLAWILSAATEQSRYDSMLDSAERKLGPVLSVFSSAIEGWYRSQHRFVRVCTFDASAFEFC